ncbi:spore coat protein [Candidatus Amesbacteria bacterium RIFCSPHIGHO2_01_FULL_48_32]|uniref:glucose-1-phosphate thymidylyltransferase n=1 Tax=Candidatus Amesbacteria bacterium RIFCSPLOWO2_01_FULL_48_25 TaxID=1797259 RepID=A0A1F4ZEI2_9BACT|nr:MAG: spore coat protein [Candidatus Amesbacteria bacterium RIFCSPHIGHO2_01_FULL_48_32]OGD04047.1 MAG: spore coat protein [Candidatus Amesbacteria bacterium RIFCSPLOWO2_01_FULL_48_25]HJZ05689.1 sugar phosphate nucleotidyltransferase [Patescibacteria group bacterium]
MKGVILAGGLGTRLYPLTYATNKHLLPIYDEPMIYYPIRTLVRAGIREAMIVVSGPHSGQFISILKNGKELGLNHLEYGYQDNPTGGLADGLKVAEDFAEGKPITFILGDNVTDADISKSVTSFTTGSVMFLKKVPDPERFGVPVFDKNHPKKLVGIVEKPVHPPSQYASVGLYLFDHRCFSVARKLKLSKRGQLEITDVQNYYIRDGSMKWEELKGYWHDVGTFDSLLAANVYWAKEKGLKV